MQKLIKKNEKSFQDQTSKEVRVSDKITDGIILFDFDGTLVVTEVLAREVIENYLVQKNIPNQEQFSQMIVGRTWKAATERMVELAEEQGFTVDPAPVLAKIFKDEYRIRFESGVKLVPGVLEKLEEIKGRARFMGIVTGSEHHEVQTIMKMHGFAHYFEKIWAYGDYEKSKPDPSPYLKAMQDLSCKPGEVLVFEDSKAGMQSAFAAGLEWVQVAHEEHSLDVDPRSLLVIHDWHELVLNPSSSGPPMKSQG